MVSKERKQKMIEETKMLVELFLDSNASDIELSKKTGISSSTVGRRLTNHDLIALAFPDNALKVYTQVLEQRKKNLQMAKIMGGQTSMHSRTYIKDGQGKFQGSSHLRLDVFYQDQEQQMKLLMHIALTFRAKIPLLAELFQLDEKELLNTLMTCCGGAYNSLLYLFYHDEANQEVAREQIIEFYRDFLEAKRTKNNTLVNEVVRRVTDYKASEILKNHDNQEEITPEMLDTIINYQLKYAISDTELVSIFGLDDQAYQKELDLFWHDNNHQDLKEKYDYLTNYHQKMVDQKVASRN